MKASNVVINCGGLEGVPLSLLAVYFLDFRPIASCDNNYLDSSATLQLGGNRSGKVPDVFVVDNLHLVASNCSLNYEQPALLPFLC
jgi:hypothetical protein